MAANRPAIRANLLIEPSRLNDRVRKRIVVCCDGTWQDGVMQKHCWQHSNVLKISRLLDHDDDRFTPPIPQIVFYQAGIGCQHNFYSEYIEGPTGSTLALKVQEAYAFITHNYQPGDEIFLFGFSRGAYTVRMVAAFIGEIGVLDKKDMDHFADIFIAYQKRGKATEPKEIAEYDKILQPWNNPNASGKIWAGAHTQRFTIKCVGVFDTVGDLGLPKELTLNKKVEQLFGFPDKLLGTHIHHAFHAMALNETREDFNVTKFEQTPAGREKGQTLQQVWFAGSHADIGGGWQAHDLSDLSLAWMASNIEEMLSLDKKYLFSLPRPTAPWGEQPPHDPATGIFKLADEIQRTLPTKTDDITHEYVHPSVMCQTVELPQLETNIQENPDLLCSLHPLEEMIKTEWPQMPGQLPEGDEAKSELKSQESMREALIKMTKLAEENNLKTIKTMKDMVTRNLQPENRTNAVAEGQSKTEVMVDERSSSHHNGSFLGAIIDNFMH